MLLMEE